MNKINTIYKYNFNQHKFSSILISLCHYQYHAELICIWCILMTHSYLFFFTAALEHTSDCVYCDPDIQTQHIYENQAFEEEPEIMEQQDINSQD